MSRGPSLPRGVRLASAGRPPSPLGRLLWRVALAIALIAFVAIGTYLTRDGYRDAAGDGVSLLDSFYYATVSVTTTGYGDVVPLSDGARLFTTLVVTPVRILFLILVVGTTVELLTSQTLTALRIERWRRRLRDHVIVCGYGTKGRAAATAMVGGRKVPKERVVIVERSPVAAQEAARDGYNTVTGDASRSVALEEANVASARTVIICTADDESAALITLTVRALNRDAVIVAPAREEENADLLRQAGASSVVLTARRRGAPARPVVPPPVRDHRARGPDDPRPWARPGRARARAGRDRPLRPAPRGRAHRRRPPRRPAAALRRSRRARAARR